MWWLVMVRRSAKDLCGGNEYGSLDAVLVFCDAGNRKLTSFERVTKNAQWGHSTQTVLQEVLLCIVALHGFLLMTDKQPFYTLPKS